MSAAAIGLLFQAGPCAGLTPAQQELLNQQLGQVVARQIGTLFSDTIFFFLDNALVRLTG